MSEETKIIVTRPENAAEFTERRHKEVTEREKAQADLTAAALGWGQSREGFTTGTMLEGCESTEDVIDVLVHGRKPKSKERAK